MLLVELETLLLPVETKLPQVRCHNILAKIDNFYVIFTLFSIDGGYYGPYKPYYAETQGWWNHWKYTINGLKWFSYMN